MICKYADVQISLDVKCVSNVLIRTSAYPRICTSTRQFAITVAVSEINDQTCNQPNGKADPVGIT